MRSVAAWYLAVALFFVVAAAVSPGPYGLGFVPAIAATAPLGVVLNMISRGRGGDTMTLAAALGICAVVQAGVIHLIQTAVRRLNRK